MADVFNLPKDLIAGDIVAGDVDPTETLSQQVLHRKIDEASNTYERVHFETDTQMILLPDGTILDDYLTEVVHAVKVGYRTDINGLVGGDGLNIKQVNIVNDLVTGGTSDVLSAEQGKTLNTSIANINNTITNMETEINTKADKFYLSYTSTTGTWYRNDSAGGIPEEFTITGNDYQVQTVQGKNLFDKDRITAGYYISSDDGSIIATAYNNNASDYIPVSETNYTISGLTYTQPTIAVGLAWYDSSKVFISSSSFASAIGNGTYTRPDTAAYVRYTVNDTDLTTSQIEVGNTATDYEAFVPTSPSVEYPSTIQFIPSGTIITVKDGSDNVITTITLEQDLHKWDSFNVLTGVYTIGTATIESYNSESIPGAYISSTGELSAGATIVYQLETPNTINGTSTVVSLPAGVCNIISNSSVLISNIALLYIIDLKIYVNNNIDIINNLVNDSYKLSQQNLLNILRLKLQMSLSAKDIDAWADLLDNNDMLNFSESTAITNGLGELTSQPSDFSPVSTHSQDITIGYDSTGTILEEFFMVPCNMTITGFDLYAKRIGSSTSPLVSCMLYKYNGVGDITDNSNWTQTNPTQGFPNITYYNTTTTSSLFSFTFNSNATVSLEYGILYKLRMDYEYSASGTYYAIGGSATDEYFGTINNITYGQLYRVSSTGTKTLLPGNDIFFTLHTAASDSDTAIAVWNPVTSTEALSKIAVTSNQNSGTGTIIWYISQDGISWTQITNLDELQTVDFTSTSVYLKCVLTGDATVDSVAWGGY